MGQIAKIRRADIEKAAQFFDEAPEVQPEEVTRKEAIRILAPKIKAMRRKGYSWAKIAEVLGTFGITIEADLLASYQRVASERASGGTKRARRAAGGSPPGGPGAQPVKASGGSGVATGTVPSAPAVGAGTAKPPEAAPTTAGARAPARSRSEAGSGEGSAR